MRDNTYFVYMLASGRYGTFYIGMTNDLLRRVAEHRDGTGSKFTTRCKVFLLVWCEVHRENPHWIDLYPSLTA